MFRGINLDEMSNVKIIFSQERARLNEGLVKDVQKIEAQLKKYGITFEVGYREKLSKEDALCIANFGYNNPTDIRKEVFSSKINKVDENWADMKASQLAGLIYRFPSCLSTILVIDSATQRVYTADDFFNTFEL